MSRRDLPGWARALAAILLVVASWWVVNTEGLTDFVGRSIGILALGIVAVSIIRGLGATLGVWPEGNFRPDFIPWIVVSVAGVFAIPIALSRVGGSGAAEGIVDVGVWVAVVAGVVAWGLVVAFVPQRPYAKWLAGAAGLALLPYLIEVVATDASRQVCVLGPRSDPGGADCQIGLAKAVLFFVPAAIAGALLTFELGFRRLLIGDAESTGAVVIVIASFVVVVWGWAVGSQIPWFGSEPWLLGGTALAAGSLYVLSGSLLVSSCYTGTVLGTHVALGLARKATGIDISVFAAGDGLVWLHVGIGALLLGLVGKRQGLLGGLR